MRGLLIGLVIVAIIGGFVWLMAVVLKSWEYAFLFMFLIIFVSMIKVLFFEDH